MQRSRRRRINSEVENKEIQIRKVQFMEEIDYKMEVEDGSYNLMPVEPIKNQFPEIHPEEPFKKKAHLLEIPIEDTKLIEQ